MCEPPRIYPFFPEYTIFLITTCDPLTIYPSFPEYTPFLTTICDPPRIYPSFPEYTPFSTNICDPPRIYPSLLQYTPFSTTMCDPPSRNLPGGIVQDLPRGRLWGAHKPPGYNLGGRYISRLYTGCQLLNHSCISKNCDMWWVEQ